MIGDFLSKKFNQNFIVENMTGGGTIIATNRVTKASPDGYTLLLHNLQILRQRHAVQEHAVRHRERFDRHHVDQQRSAGAGWAEGSAAERSELLAFMKKDRLKAAPPARRHRASAEVWRRKPRRIANPYRARAAMTDLMGGHSDLFLL